MPPSAHELHLHFTDDGPPRPPLLLLHGLFGTGDDFRHAFDLAALRRDYRLIVPDLRGHGRTDNPSRAFSFRQCACDVVALVDRLNADTFRAVGTSLGAKTLLHVATAHPVRVTSMVLVSATPYFPETTRAMMRAAAAAEHSDDEWQFMRERHLLGDEQIRALWRAPAQLADDPDDLAFTKETLEGIAARTLIVAGDRDPLYPVELAVELHRAIAPSALWVVPNGGHTPIFGDARAEFERIAVDFLRA